ncbi:MAG: TIGR01459 family HAD-type hydrolase, partial [Hyphomicrobiales bacterium]|nr:TIGR01459 family HAD-type hydrolase [Hyphomicrobiales bacterium]
MTTHGSITSSWAFGRYEAVRPRLPSANFPAQPRQAQNLGELFGEFDAFVFDSFGVLNVGDTIISGASERISALRAGGKQLAILTNSATVPLAGLVDKYASLGLQFTRREIISSREVLANALQLLASELTWGIAAPAASNVAELPCKCYELEDNN